MNINLNIGKGYVDAAQTAAAAAPAQEKKDVGSADWSGGTLTISRGTASAEDIEAAAIPESALSRKDRLGALIAEAFCLPAPPMPNFAS